MKISPKTALCLLALVSAPYAFGMNNNDLAEIKKVDVEGVSLNRNIDTKTDAIEQAEANVIHGIQNEDDQAAALRNFWIGGGYAAIVVPATPAPTNTLRQQAIAQLGELYRNDTISAIETAETRVVANMGDDEAAQGTALRNFYTQNRVDTASSLDQMEELEGRILQFTTEEEGGAILRTIFKENN
jgi:hypothetical protein